MENIFLITEEEVVENFKKQNPTKEDYFNILCESDPEFSSKQEQSLRSSWDDCNDLKEIDRYNIELPFGYEEIELYDNSKGFDENFEKGKSKKYIIIQITNDRKFEIVPRELILPTPQSKCVIDIDKLEEQNSFFEYIPIEYDNIFGLRLISFIGYNSDFFLCDERIIFETLLIKYKSFDFKPFYWSKEVIFKEVGIKKDRATKILEKFINLGIVSKELKKASIENRPMQITYYDLNAEKIIELVPKIYKERENFSAKSKLEKYLMPALNRKKTYNKMQ